MSVLPASLARPERNATPPALFGATNPAVNSPLESATPPMAKPFARLASMVQQQETLLPHKTSNATVSQRASVVKQPAKTPPHAQPVTMASTELPAQLPVPRLDSLPRPVLSVIKTPEAVIWHLHVLLRSGALGTVRRIVMLTARMYVSRPLGHVMRVCQLNGTQPTSVIRLVVLPVRLTQVTAMTTVIVRRLMVLRL